MFKIANFFVLLLTVVLSVHPTSAQPTANLVAHYALATNALDTGTNGNNGLVVSSVAFNTGYSATFNSSPQDDAGYIFAYPALNRNTSFTISAWVFPTYYNVGLPATIMYERAGGDACGAASAPNYGMQIYAGRFSFDISTLANGACTLNRISSPDTVTLNEWSHVLATYDNITGTQRLYVNGALRAEATVGTELRTVSNARFAMSRNLGGTQAFHGDMADVRVYDRVLTATEIGQLVPASVVRKQIIVPAIAYPGTQFTNPLGAQSASCSITAYGLWSNGQGAQTTDADGYGSACNQCPETGSPSQRLVMQRGASWEPIGKTKQVSLSSNEIVRFANNDSIGFYPDNTGSMTLDIVCEEPTPVPTVTLTLPRATILTQTIAHGDGHTGARMDDGITAGQELRTSETLQVDCSNTCVWSASVEPISASSWLKFTSANSGAAQPGGPGLLTFSIDPFEDTVSSRTGTIRVTVNGGATATWQVRQNPLTDTDEDGVADEWEYRGIPLAASIREYLPNAIVGQRNLWFWIDEMAGLAGNTRLTKSAVKRFRAAFERQGFLVTVVRSTDLGFSALTNIAPVIDKATPQAPLTAQELATNIDLLKAANFYRTTPSGVPTPMRDRAWRYIVWGSKYRQRNLDGSDSASSSSGIAPSRQNLAFIAAEYDCIESNFCMFGSGLTDDLAQSGTLLHEVGHTFALGHGGPVVDMTNRVLFDVSGAYRPNYNMKPNHLSVMNYAYQLSGLVTVKEAAFQTDYAGERRPTLNEESLDNFWAAPVRRADGTPDMDYGLRYACRRTGGTPLQPKVQVADVALVELGAGQTATKCGFLNARPKVADLDHTGAAGAIEAQSEWSNLFLSYGKNFLDFLGTNRVAASSLRDSLNSLPQNVLDDLSSEQPAAKNIYPTNYRHQIAMSSDVLRVRANEAYELHLTVQNVGRQSDQYTVYVADAIGVTAEARTTNLLQPGGQFNVTIPVSFTSAANGTLLTIAAVSFAQPQSQSTVDVRVVVVENVADVQLPNPLPDPGSPTDFSFPAVLSANVDTFIESTAASLNGFTGALSLFIHGGEVRVNGSDWISNVTTVSPGDILRLRVLSSPYGGDTRTAEVAVGGLVRSFDVTTATTCDLDIDGDANVSAEIDGVLLSRYMLGYRGSALTNGLTLTGSRVTPQAITDFIGSGVQYEVFGRIAVPVATTDGIVLTRLMLGFPDTSILNGIEIPNDAVFTQASEIRSYVTKKCGTALGRP